MPFYSLSTVQFRNLADSTIDLLAPEVFFTGENGQGKSNLLEALYYSAYGASFRTHTDSEIVKRGFDSMSVRTLFKEGDGDTHTTRISIERGLKKIERDGKMVKDRKELVSAMPCVLYNHDDLDFVSGSPERRRFFLDQTLSMYDLLYIDTTRRYKRVLKSRNLMLKEGRTDILDTYDFQLAQNGLEVQKQRKICVFKFNQIFSRLYAEVSGIEGVSIRYNPSWKKADGDSAIPSVEDVIAHLQKKRESERIMGTSLSGPHRDRIDFEREGTAFVPTASTGQRRLIALVLRSAQASFYREETGRKPVLLMDDVLLELDPDKRERMTALLPEYDQLFCTFLPGEPYQRYRHNATRIYEIASGSWQERT